MRCAAYVRVSTDDQKDNGYSIDSQLRMIKEYCEKKNYDIIDIYKAGTKAKVEADWNLDTVYIEDFISESGADWNFDQHKQIDTKPTFDDFRKTVADYLSWEVEQLIKGEGGLGK